MKIGMIGDNDMKVEISVGSIIAVLLSWSVNHSILYCIAHGFCSWFYVIYWLLAYYL